VGVVEWVQIMRMKQFLDSDMFITVLDSIGDGFGDMLLIEIGGNQSELKGM
jgi:hypothetical protein